MQTHGTFRLAPSLVRPPSTLTGEDIKWPHIASDPKLLLEQAFSGRSGPNQESPNLPEGALQSCCSSCLDGLERIKKVYATYKWPSTVWTFGLGLHSVVSVWLLSSMPFQPSPLHAVQERHLSDHGQRKTAMALESFGLIAVRPVLGCKYCQSVKAVKRQDFKECNL